MVMMLAEYRRGLCRQQPSSRQQHHSSTTLPVSVEGRRGGGPNATSCTLPPLPSENSSLSKEFTLHSLVLSVLSLSCRRSVNYNTAYMKLSLLISDLNQI